MSWRQHAKLYWRGSGISAKECTFTTSSNPPAELGGAGDIVTATQAVSTAGLVAVQIVPTLLVGSDPSGGTYPNARDYVKLQFRTAGRGVVDYHYPCPLAATLTGSGLSDIDPTNPLIEALVAAIMANATGDDGSAITTFLGGGRYRYNPKAPF